MAGILFVGLVLAGTAYVSPRFEQPLLVEGELCEFDKPCVDALLLNGAIPTQWESLVARLDQSRSKTLCFNSPGGDAEAGAHLSRWLYEHDYATCVAPFDDTLSASCDSACVTAFMGARRSRRVGAGGYLFIHGAGWDGVSKHIDGPCPSGAHALASKNCFLRWINTFAENSQRRYTASVAPETASIEKLLDRTAQIAASDLVPLLPAEMTAMDVVNEPPNVKLHFKSRQARRN